MASKIMAKPIIRRNGFDAKESVAILTQAVESLDETQISIGERLDAQTRDVARGFRDITGLIEKQSSDFRVEVKTLAGDTQAKFDRIFDRQAAKDKPNLPVWIAVGMLILALVSGGAVIIKQQTENTVMYKLGDFSREVAGITGVLRNDLDRNTARDEVSQRDREKLFEVSTKNTDKISSLEATDRTHTAGLVEIETQFKAGDMMRNIQFAEQQRTNNILFQIAQGVKPITYPQAPYFFPAIHDGTIKP